MLKQHGDAFRAKCEEEGMTPREREDDCYYSDSDSEFTPELFAQRMAEWVAVDDQVRGIALILCLWIAKLTGCYA
jgi:hypothetical protein